MGVVRVVFVFVSILASATHAQSIPPPRPEPVPAELLSGVTLKLPVGGGFVLLDAPGTGWKWTRVGDSYYSCEAAPKDPGPYRRPLQVYRVVRIPTRKEAQAEFSRQTVTSRERKRITSWTPTAVPVPGSIRYTMVNTIGDFNYSFVGYYAPQRLHLIGPAGEDGDAQQFSRFVASYRVE